jgi:periplasmic protein TonB
MTLKKLFIIALFALPTYTYSQDTTFYDINDKKVESLSLARYYSISSTDSINLNRKVVRDFYLSGRIKTEKHITTILGTKENTDDNLNIDGKYREWYENGQLRKEVDYTNGKINKQACTYWKDGQLKTQSIYKNGKFKSSKNFDSTGKEVEFAVFDESPEFPGGEKALSEFISKNLQYPIDMQKSGIQGRVIVRFAVAKDGNVTDISIMKTSNIGFNDEAQRVVKSLPKWKAGIQNEEPVKVYFSAPIIFQLN